MAKRFFTWLLLFVGILLVFESFQPTEPTEDVTQEDVVLSTSEESYVLGEPILVTVQNNLDETLTVSSLCPSSPLQVSRYDNGSWQDLESSEGEFLLCETDDEPEVEHHMLRQPDQLEFVANESTELDLAPWKDQLFPENGHYRISLNLIIDGEERNYFTEVDIEDRGFFSSIAYNIFYRPMFNLLLFFASILPGYRFGLAVIALTLLIRLLLLVPNQRALESQKAMMKIQPELEAIKKKYKGDQEKISQETLALWQKHKVNPAGGCLPLLLQLPILIALFYVVKGGFSPYQGYIVYGFLQHLEVAKVSSDFFGILNLEVVNATWLPVLVGLLQFFQMKLTFARRQTKKDGTEVIDIKEDGSAEPAKKKSLQEQMNVMNKTMLYFMPVMIALMVASLPSGVGLYLFISTLFGIGQQLVVNRRI